MTHSPKFKRRTSQLRKRKEKAGSQEKAQDIRKDLVKVRIDPKRPPTLLKSRINGWIDNLINFNVSDAKAYIWTDKDGRKLLIQRKEDTGNIAANIAEIARVMMEEDDGSLAKEPPQQLIIELGPNDSENVILAKIGTLDPNLISRVRFIKGGKKGQIFSDLRDQVEAINADHWQDEAHLEILRLLETAIAQENEPDTAKNLNPLIQLIAQMITLANHHTDNLPAAFTETLITLRDGLTEEYIRRITSPRRTPTEVMVHLLHEIQKAAVAEPNSGALEAVNNLLQDRLLKHQLTIHDTIDNLARIGAYLREDNRNELAKLTLTLLSQLPDPEKGQVNPPTRLHDNVYGRIMDTAIINFLVTHPPQAVVNSMTQSANWLSEWISATIGHYGVKAEGAWQEAAADLQEYLNTHDERFWFAKTPGLRQLAVSANPLADLLALLSNPGTNGQEMVAIPYLIMKLSITNKEDQLVPWMDGTGVTYDKITAYRHRTDKPTTNIPTEEFKFDSVNIHQTSTSGITLRHQLKDNMEDASLDKTERPSLRNIPIFDPRSGRPAHNPRNLTVTDVALQHGLPFASGISGSTNAMLFFLNYINRRHGQGLDPKAFLLSTMLFMVYDGGHSLHEVLWTANLVDHHLGLGLNIAPDHVAPEAFVADYTRLQALFEGTEMGDAFNQALDHAFAETTEHFAKYSKYSKDRSS